VEQRERQRMAHILHDNLQQLLVGARFNVAILARKAKSSAEIEAAQRVNDVLDEAIRQSQALAVDLCPPILYEGSLTQALQWVVKQMAERHGLTVTLNIGEPVPGQIAEDIRMVLINAIREILFNVVKHAGVKQASLTATLPSEGGLRIAVSDQGVGFDVSAVREMSNTSGGFGLFAIHERINSIGGKLEIVSSPVSGTQISVTVPLEDTLTIPDVLKHEKAIATESDQPAVGFAASDAGAVPPTSSVRVLLVDDHPVMRQGLMQLMQDEGDIIVVGEASDGAMAVEMVRRALPHVVLMDISMPGMNGIDATRIIHAEFPEVHVIGLSMYDESERAEEMLAAGAVGYVTKSDTAERVIDEIYNLSK
jgi:CheY-like chemotaxis protein/anti-sigma regulatory factor (Ser/Thr protein kinase)